MTDIAVTDNCKNPDSYGEICVKCNKCGRFGEQEMTREEAIEIYKEWVRRDSEMTDSGVADRLENIELYKMAISALEQIDKIKQIIAIPNSVIQEDVMKYKMICEVLNDK